MDAHLPTEAAGKVTGTGQAQSVTAAFDPPGRLQLGIALKNQLPVLWRHPPDRRP
jgi:hypothetical protein